MDRFFEVIVTEHRMTVFGLLFSLVRDRELAEDLAQETFLVLLGKIDEIDVSQPILPWLLRTARNLACNARRHQSVEQRLFLKGEVSAVFWEGLGRPELGADWSEKFSALQQCRDALSPPQKEAVTLFYNRNESCDSIASRMGTATAAIQNRLVRARRALRECIEQKLRRHT